VRTTGKILEILENCASGSGRDDGVSRWNSPPSSIKPPHTILTKVGSKEDKVAKMMISWSPLPFVGSIFITSKKYENQVHLSEDNHSARHKNYRKLMSIKITFSYPTCFRINID
jgi:hypothetical protein